MLSPKVISVVYASSQICYSLFALSLHALCLNYCTTEVQYADIQLYHFYDFSYIQTIVFLKQRQVMLKYL